MIFVCAAYVSLALQGITELCTPLVKRKVAKLVLTPTFSIYAPLPLHPAILAVGNNLNLNDAVPLSLVKSSILTYTHVPHRKKISPQCMDICILQQGLKSISYFQLLCAITAQSFMVVGR